MNPIITTLVRRIGLTPALVRYHTSRLTSAVDAMRRQGTPTGMPVAHSTNFRKHQLALRQLGFLVEREFALEGRPLSNPVAYRALGQWLRSRIPGDLWSFATDGARLAFTLPASQVCLVEQLLREYDQEPRSTP